MTDTSQSNSYDSGPGNQTPVASVVKTAAMPLTAPGSNPVKRGTGFAMSADFAARTANDAWNGDIGQAAKDGATATAIAVGSSQTAMGKAADVIAQTKTGAYIMKGVQIAEDVAPRFPVIGTAASVAGAGIKAVELHAAGQDLKAEGTLAVKVCEITGAIGGGLAGGFITTPTVAGVPLGVAAGATVGEEVLGTACARGWNYLHGGKEPVSDTALVGLSEDAYSAARKAGGLIQSAHGKQAGPGGASPTVPANTPDVPAFDGSHIHL